MKNTIRITAFLAIAILLITGTYKILSWKDTTGGYLSSTQQLYATGDDLIELVFMGSSHCYCSIKPSILWDTYGISSFDMAVSGQDKDSTYYTLVELLKTQSPQVVCVDVYGLLFEEQSVLGNVYRNMLSMKPSSISNDLIRSYVEKEDQMDFLLRWPIIHTRYRELTKYDFTQYEPSIYGRGYGTPYYNMHNNAPSAEILNCSESTPLSVKNKEWLDKLIALSEKENFSLVFFFAPTEVSLEHQMIINGAEDYVLEHGIDFLDFNKLAADVGLDYSTDFMDAAHLNAYGAEKLTAYMGTYLYERYLFLDHRGDSDYYLWDEDSQYFKQLANARLIEQTKDLKEYLNLLKSVENITIIFSLDGAYFDSELDLQGALDMFGIPESEYNCGGKWVFENGECVFYMDNASDEVYMRDLSQTDTLRLHNLDNAAGTNTADFSQIEINSISYGSCLSGLSVVVYDTFTDTIISRRGYY